MFWNRQVRTSPALCSMSAPYGALSDWKRLRTPSRDRKKDPSKKRKADKLLLKGSFGKHGEQCAESCRFLGGGQIPPLQLTVLSGFGPNPGIPPMERWASHFVIVVHSSTSLSHQTCLSLSQQGDPSVAIPMLCFNHKNNLANSHPVARANVK